MNSRLSALKFIRNNKRQVWLLIIALALSFMTMYLINFLFMASEESFRPICLTQPKKVTYINVSNDAFGIFPEDYEDAGEMEVVFKERKDKFMEDLKEYPGVTDAYETQVLICNYNGIAGGIGYPFPLVEPDMVEPFIEHMGAKLVEGRMPEGYGEILIDSMVLKNQSVKVGDYFMEDNYGRSFKIVGALESDCFVSVGTPQGFTNAGWYITVLGDESTSDMSKVIEDLGGKVTANVSILDSNTRKEYFETDFVAVLENMVLGVILVVTVFLTIAIVVAYVSFMRSRVNEYCLYSSIGYSKKDIYAMMMRELILIFAISIGLGIILTIVSMILLGENLLAYLGLLYKFYYSEQIFRQVAVFATIVGVLQIPMLVTLYKIRTVDLIEE